MLSMGRFETEVDLTLHGSYRECLRYCGLIGPNNDEASLKQYAKSLTKRWIEEQVQYFPNAQRVIDFWIITYLTQLDVIILKKFDFDSTSA